MDDFTRRMGVSVRSGDAAPVAGVVNSGADREILRALRGETATLVLHVRLMNQSRADEAKQRMSESEFNDLFGTEEVNDQSDL